MKKRIKRLLKKVRFNSKANSMVLFLFAVVLLIGVGFAYLNTTLSIGGVVNVENSSWDIHFENVVVSNGSVAATTQPTISNNTTVSFGVILENPGDFYEFTVDVVNDGTYDAKIDSIDILPVLTSVQQEYFAYTVKYVNGAAIQIDDALNAGDQETIKIRIEYLVNADTSLYPDEDIDFDFSVSLDYLQGTGNAIANPVSFSDDGWSTIIAAVQSGNTSTYNVGDTKTLDLGSLGTHTLRIVNKTTPAECSTSGFSQSACGFVVEFADVVSTQKMNTSSTNSGGWPATEMRTYISNTIYAAMPSELKNNIISTTVVSGHGSGESTNFTSTDKLYLLSPKEIGFNSTEDTANTQTRLLDYYNTNNSNSARVKKYNSSNTNWWLRSAYSTSTYSFHYVYTGGSLNSSGSSSAMGVSPAFRIG